jgi:hypothetical protein
MTQGPRSIWTGDNGVDIFDLCRTRDAGTEAVTSEGQKNRQGAPGGRVFEVWRIAKMLENALMSKLARLNRRPQKEGENVARRRFQSGSVKRRGEVWIGRYLEDVEEHGVIRRKHRTVTLSRIRGSDGRVVTEHQARRLLQPHLDRINSNTYQGLRPKKTILFSDFSSKWKSLILSQKKPSTQLTIRGHLAAR